MTGISNVRCSACYIFALTSPLPLCFFYYFARASGSEVLQSVCLYVCHACTHFGAYNSRLPTSCQPDAAITSCRHSSGPVSTSMGVFIIRIKFAIYYFLHFNTVQQVAARLQAKSAIFLSKKFRIIGIHGIIHYSRRVCILIFFCISTVAPEAI